MLNETSIRQFYGQWTFNCHHHFTGNLNRPFMSFPQSNPHLNSVDTRIKISFYHHATTPSQQRLPLMTQHNHVFIVSRFRRFIFPAVLVFLFLSPFFVPKIMLAPKIVFTTSAFFATSIENVWNHVIMRSKKAGKEKKTVFWVFFAIPDVR